MNEVTEKIALPTASQLKWADDEIGVIIHFDMQVFEPDYSFRKQWGYTPDPRIFNPSELNTDQWIETAVSAGAKYAVLVAKHCSGFSLWPTKAHSYSVASSPWRGGKGDIVADFFNSCKKYGVKPGLYCSAACNAFMNVDNPGKVRSGDPVEQARYNKVVETQLTELWSQYGELFEIWFDGGVLAPEQGGPDIVPIMRRLQPDAVVFGGPAGCPSLARFVGNERGEAPDPFWSSTDNLEAFDGTTEVAGLGGNPDGAVWVCGESDMPNRDQKKAFQGGWFWRKGDDQFVYSLDHLTECYFTSVARNTNLLLGMVIDPRGLVPEVDQKRFAEFGRRIKEVFSDCLAKKRGEGNSMTLKLPEDKAANMLVIMEDIAYGERIRQYMVEAFTGGKWIKIWQGTCVGHKRIERFIPLQASEIRLTIMKSTGTPKIREFSAWQVEDKLFSIPLSQVQRNRLSITRNKSGYVNVRSINPNLSVRYTVDGSEPNWSSPVFGQPFLMRDGGIVKAFSFISEESRSATTAAVFGCDRSSWRIVSTSLDSPFKNGGSAGVEHLLNDDPETYWHTYHNDKSLSAPPHEVVLDMGSIMSVKAFTFMPGHEAIPDQYEFHLSTDGKTWALAAEGYFTDIKENPGMRLITMKKSVFGRFIRFVAKHVIDDGDYVIAAGIGAVVE